MSGAMMDAHAGELLTVAIWCLVGVSGLILALAKWGAGKLFERMDRQDTTMQEIRDLLNSEVKQLREMQHQLDKRVIRIETTCWAQHGRVGEL